MKHKASREIYDYWKSVRGARIAPEWSEFKPAALRTLLCHSFILSFDPARDHPFLVAGTRICAAFDRELKDHAFASLWTPEDVDDIRELLSFVGDEAEGLVAGARGLNAQHAPADLELLLLPLSCEGSTHVRVLGAFAAVGAPYWLDVQPIVEMRLGSVRFLAPSHDARSPSLHGPIIPIVDSPSLRMP